MPIPGEVWTDGIAQILDLLDYIQLLPMDVEVTCDRIPLVGNTYHLTYIGIKLHLPLVFPLLQRTDPPGVWCSTPRGSPGVGRNTLFLSSPHLRFIIVFIRDLFVTRDDPLMS